MSSSAATAHSATDKATSEAEPRTERRLLHCPATANHLVFRRAAEQCLSVVVQLSSVRTEHAGLLKAFVRESVEEHLECLGAAPSTSAPEDPLDSYLKEALYRARLLGAGGIAIAFGGLSELAGKSGTLNEADSLVVHTLLTCANTLALQLYFPPSAAEVSLLGAPVALSQLLPDPESTSEGAIIEYQSAVAPSANPKSKADLTDQVVVGDSIPTPDVAQFTVAQGDSVPAASASTSETPQTESVELEKTQERCDEWARQLNDMAGPKVHGAIERAFARAYLPLQAAVTAGQATPASTESLCRWGEDFAQSYSAAFDQMQRHSRRPRMVKDIAGLAAKWAEHYRVARCELLVVTGLRYDLAELLNQRLEASLESHATCVEQSVLWAALPSNSRSQPLDQLQEPLSTRVPASGTTPVTAASGSTPQRLHRLDTLEQEFVASGESAAPRIERLSRLLESEIAPWMMARKPDTLVVVFGDHGFALGSEVGGTGPVGIGGALPEQVLVPAAAWLVRTRHESSRSLN